MFYALSKASVCPRIVAIALGLMVNGARAESYWVGRAECRRPRGPGERKSRSRLLLKLYVVHPQVDTSPVRKRGK